MGRIAAVVCALLLIGGIATCTAPGTAVAPRTRPSPAPSTDAARGLQPPDAAPPPAAVIPVEDATPGPDQSAAPTVAACTGTRTLLVTEALGHSVRVVETRLDGTRVKTWFEQPGASRPAVDLKQKLAVGREGLVKLDTGEQVPLPEAKHWSWPVFVPGKRWIVSPIDAGGIEIFDLATRRLVRQLAGDSPSVAPDGSAIFYLARSQDHIDVMRFAGGQSRRVWRIELSSQGGPYGVTEVVALSGSRVAYRIYDEHEYRYYERGRPLFERKVGEPREQFDLTLSRDGQRAAFAERHWNELTYIVIVDVNKGTRANTPYYGSFPVLDKELVLFASDPSFVQTSEPEFRQIGVWAIYAYDVVRRSLCRVAQYSHQAAPY